MPDIEIDLQTLEDMCSELEEDALLFDKNLKVLWMNSVLRKNIGINIRDTYSDFESIESNIRDRFGDYVVGKSHLKKTFNTGRLIKSIYTFESKKIKVISIPIKYGSEVVYVLDIIELIEELDSLKDLPERSENSPLANLSDFQHKSLKNTALLKDDLSDTALINSQSHKTLFEKKIVLDELVGRSENDVDSIVKGLNFFMNNLKMPCFIVSKNSVIIENYYFIREFKSNSVLKNLIYQSFSDFPNDISILKNLFKFKFDIKQIVIDKSGPLTIYFFIPKNIPLSKQKSSKNILFDASNLKNIVSKDASIESFDRRNNMSNDDLNTKADRVDTRSVKKKIKKVFVVNKKMATSKKQVVANKKSVKKTTITKKRKKTVKRNTSI